MADLYQDLYQEYQNRFNELTKDMSLLMDANATIQKLVQSNTISKEVLSAFDMENKIKAARAELRIVKALYKTWSKSVSIDEKIIEDAQRLIDGYEDIYKSIEKIVKNSEKLNNGNYTTGNATNHSRSSYQPASLSYDDMVVLELLLSNLRSFRDPCSVSIVSGSLSPDKSTAYLQINAANAWGGQNILCYQVTKGRIVDTGAMLFNAAIVRSLACKNSINVDAINREYRNRINEKF